MNVTACMIRDRPGPSANCEPEADVVSEDLVSIVRTLLLIPSPQAAQPEFPLFNLAASTAGSAGTNGGRAPAYR
jgi:hypothetical protein